jgi:hypothetical protein
LKTEGAYFKEGDNGKFRFSIAGTPPGFLVDANTGLVQGFPKSATTPGEPIEAEVSVEDGSGSRVALDTIKIVVEHPDPFTVRKKDLNTTRNPSGDAAYARLVEMYSTLFIGTTYSIPGPLGDASALFSHPKGGNYRAIAYKIEVQAVDFFGEPLKAQFSPGEFLINPETGKLLGVPDRAGSYTGRLMALDGGGQRAMLWEWPFEVGAMLQLGTTAKWSLIKREMSIGGADSPLYEGANQRDVLEIGQFYSVAGPNISKTELFVNAPVDGAGEPKPITYSVRVYKKNGELIDSDDEIMPGKYFVAYSGEMYFNPLKPALVSKDTTEEYIIGLVGLDSMGRETVVNEWNVAIMPSDTSVPSYGPSGTDCFNGGQHEDGVVFDRIFFVQLQHDCLGRLKLPGAPTSYPGLKHVGRQYYLRCCNGDDCGTYHRGVHGHKIPAASREDQAARLCNAV